MKHSISPNDAQTAVQIPLAPAASQHKVVLESPYDPFDHDLGFISRVFAGVRFIPNWLDFREHVTRLAEMRPRYLYLSFSSEGSSARRNVTRTCAATPKN